MQRILKYIISENTTPVTILDFLKKEGFSRHILSSMKNIPNTIILNGERGFGRSVLNRRIIWSSQFLKLNQEKTLSVQRWI